MPRILFWFCLAVLIENNAISQALPAILTTKQYKRGIYKDFKEFLMNSPSIDRQFEITRNTNIKHNKRGFFLLKTTDSLTNEGHFYWGVCDGQKIYVNEQNYVFSYGYSEISIIGRYCSFMGTYITKPTPLATGYSSLNIYHTGGLYALNINNGKFFLLNSGLVRTLLKKDQELANGYDQDQNKDSDEVMTKYLVAYNSKHLNDVATTWSDSVSVILYRKKSKDSVPIKVTLGDSTHVMLSQNSVFEFKTSERIVRVCVEKHCDDFSLPEKRTTYIECLTYGKLDAPLLRSQDVKIGDFESTKIRSRIRK